MLWSTFLVFCTLEVIHATSFSYDREVNSFLSFFFTCYLHDISDCIGKLDQNLNIPPKLETIHT